MHDNSITLNGLKKLAETEKFYGSRIQDAVEQLTLLSNTWRSSLTEAQNSENVSEDKINELIDILKQLLQAQKKANEIINNYHNAQISVTESIKSDIMQTVSLNPDEIVSRSELPPLIEAGAS